MLSNNKKIQSKNRNTVFSIFLVQDLLHVRPKSSSFTENIYKNK